MVTIKDRLEEFKQQKKLLLEDAKDEVVRILNSQWTAYKDKAFAHIKKQITEYEEYDNEIFLDIEKIELCCYFYSKTAIICKYMLKFLAADGIRLETNSCLFVALTKHEHSQQQCLELVDNSICTEPKDVEDMSFITDSMSHLLGVLNLSVTVFPEEEQTNESC